jgi:hypothetical protein
MSTSIFHTLVSEYKTWPALAAYLISEAGGSLRVYDRSTPESPFALIRYVKGKSDLTKPHVRVFRSVVWDTLENRPVSVTPFKSDDGESLPNGSHSTDGYTVERFLDGVMIGAFWDRYSSRWRIHTRSSLDAATRYYSQNVMFQTMFFQAYPFYALNTLDKSMSYTWVLQHPENRVVVPVNAPAVSLVQVVKINDDCTTAYQAASSEYLRLQTPTPTWTDVSARLAEWNTQFKHAAQGLMIRDAEGNRWKVRTPEYNRVRMLRGNSARRDFLWLTLWRSGGLRDYLALFPEERAMANGLVERWKRVTNDVFHFYTDVFKARTLQKTSIPAKYRPFVYGLHSQFMETLKPAGKTVVWKTALEYMNGRDIPQMLFVLNWDVRQQAKTVAEIPLEPSVSVATEVAAESQQPHIVYQRTVLSDDETDEDLPPLVPTAEVMAQVATPVGGE